MEWVQYRRLADGPVEAMHAHFEQHSYHLHSHESYSFGLTEFGAQSFGCRGESRTSSAGMVMAFNPDEPHDGRAAAEQGFTYRIVHIGPSLVTDLLTDQAGRDTGMPLFAQPVLPALVRRAAQSAPPTATITDTKVVAQRARAVLDDRFLEQVTADDLATAAGCSRFVLYRAFKQQYGLSPSEYQRLLRLRTARRQIIAGTPVAEAAGQSGFADQAHLTRWFRRCYGITPGVFQSAVTFS
jgi:AraC-like DNA-binding protein